MHSRRESDGEMWAPCEDHIVPDLLFPSPEAPVHDAASSNESFRSSTSRHGASIHTVHTEMRHASDSDSEDGAMPLLHPVSPLSMGIGDRFTLLNVHHSSDDVIRRVSQLSRRSPTPLPVMVVPDAFIAEPPASHPTTYLRRLKSALVKPLAVVQPYPVAFGWDLIPTCLLCFIGLSLLAVIDYYLVNEYISIRLDLFSPAFGSSAAILYGLPKSPFAQPRNLFAGQLFGAIMGVSLAQATRAAIQTEPLSDLVAGIAGASCCIGFMMFAQLMHPSACATAVAAASATFLDSPNDRGYLFVLCPVLAGCVVLFLVAWIGNNMFSTRSPYPMYW